MVAVESDLLVERTLRSYLPATRNFSSGQDSPRAFLERCLASIGMAEQKVQAFVAIEIEASRAAADRSTERWRAGKQRSPIDGMPVGIKDIMETVDMPTGMGSPLFTGWRSNRDAAAVNALREAGAIILGKTVTTEFATTMPGPTRNPWDLTRTPGGSSSGSAAGVAAGFLSAGLGTQVVGSTIRPASYCGVYGYKPSVGGINRGGSHDGLSQSATGVIAATLEECWTVAWEIVQRIGGDPGWPGIVGPADAVRAQAPRRLALLRTPGWDRAEPAALAALDAALAAIRAGGVEIVEQSPEIAAVERAIADAREVTKHINGWEARWPLNVYRDRDVSKLSSHMQERLAAAEAMSVDTYRRLIVTRATARAVFAELAPGCDGAVTLAATGPAPVGIESTGDTVFNVAASYLGIPALSLPKLQADGLPLGLQLLGYEQRDAALFGIAAWLDALLPTRPGK